MITILANTTSYIGEAISGIVGALIGTFGGAWLVYKFQQRHIHSVRKIAISALKDMKELAKKNNTYKKVEASFNNISDAKKRAILTALYKVGIPISIPEDGNLNIADVRFNAEVIDKDFLDDVILNINLGHCDKYFYEDISTCIASDFRIKAIRKIGIRFVNEVLRKSTLSGTTISYPDDWFLKFTWGERQTIAVLKDYLVDPYYFENGHPKPEQMDRIVAEINLGIWDTHLQWNYTAHTNIQLQNSLSQGLLNAFLNQQASAKQEENDNPQN